MRKLRLLATLAALVALALPATAQLEKFKDWDKSPEFTWYATEDEKKAWTSVTSDEEAQKFFNLFWGRRHPDYQTNAQNVFRSRFDALVVEADKLFTLGKKRGALTERGKALILLGPPKGIGSKVNTAFQAGAASVDDEPQLPGGKVILTQFQYEQEQLPAWAGLKRLVLTFTVDEGAQSETLDKTGEMKKLWKKAIAAALVNPKMTEPPRYKTREEYEAEQKAAAEAAAEAAKGPVLSAPVREALEALLAKEPHGDLGVFPIAYGDSATRLMVQLAVPAELAAASAPATPLAPTGPTDPVAAAPAAPAAIGPRVGLLVRSTAGKDAARRAEPVALQKAKADSFLDFSLPVEPGEYDVVALLLDASGATKATARRAATVPTLPKELGISSLLLASADLPAEGAKLDEPFVFATRKFVLRGDNRMLKTDGLAYLARLYNPSVDPATKKLQLKRAISIKPKSGSTIDVPQPADDAMPVPEQEGASTALVIDVAGAIVDSNLGDYFRPGEYTMTLKVTDVVSGKTVEAKAPFTLVAPPAPATAAAAKAPAPKK